MLDAECKYIPYVGPMPGVVCKYGCSFTLLNSVLLEPNFFCLIWFSFFGLSGLIRFRILGTVIFWFQFVLVIAN
jgi:hypothetical protein